MAVEDSLKNTEDNVVREQFSKCDKYDKQCKYRNNIGSCIYETCMFDNEQPPVVDVWWSKCMVCDEEYARSPKLMKIRICDSCLLRMLAAEKKPFTCVFCGKKQSHNSKIFLSGLCDTCVDKIKAAAYCGHCNRD